MNPATLDPETTWEERPPSRGWSGTGDGYTVPVDDDRYTLTIGERMYGMSALANLTESVTEARDVRRLVMGR